MLALRIQYLTGVVAAQDRGDRRRAEWPPHPDRLFSALVASWGRGGRDAAGKRALEWLEAQAPPAVACCAADRVGFRDAVTHYVPRNDLAEVDKGRNARTFPAALPEDPVVHMIWREADPGPHRAALARLAGDVAWLGHSSTLVAVRLVEDAPAPRYVPSPRGTGALRTPRPGRLDTLEEAHGEGRLAAPGGWTLYPEPGVPRPPAPAVFGEWTVFRRVGGVGMELRHAAVLTHAVHRALVDLADDPVRPLISGREKDGAVTRAPHVALVPLANLDHEHADGAIMGFAVIRPPGLDAAETLHVDKALARLDHVRTAAGPMAVERLATPDRAGLKPGRYTRPSRRWVTVTPMLLDRHPRKSLPAAEIVARAVEATGLPRPRRITLGAWPVVAGVPHPRLMLPRPGREHGKPLLHVLLEFDRPVRGPVLIGAGRFFGMGLCLPIDDTPRGEEP